MIYWNKTLSPELQNATKSKCVIEIDLIWGRSCKLRLG